jgi:hypothetical protein
MIEIFYAVRKYWDDVENLQLVCLTIAEKQLELASSIAQQEHMFNEAFITERESMYKGTDSQARAKAKSLTGGVKTKYEYEFEALRTLLDVVTLRISRFQA